MRSRLRNRCAAAGSEAAKSRALAFSLLLHSPHIRFHLAPREVRLPLSLRRRHRCAYRARLEPQQLGSVQEDRWALAAPSLIPIPPTLACEVEHAAHCVDAIRSGLGRNSRTRLSPGIGRLRHRATLSEYSVASHQGQAAERHVFAGPLDECRHGRVRLRLTLKVATLARDSGRANQNVRISGAPPL